MTSWQELTVPGLVTSVVTGGALLFQNWRNGVREDQRRAEDAAERQKDRDHARDMADSDARRQLDERWRDDRRSAYAAMISTAEECIRLADEIYDAHLKEHRFGMPTDGTNEVMEHLEAETEKLPKDMSLVALLGSQDSRAESDALGSLVRTMMMSTWMLHTIPGDGATREQMAKSASTAIGNTRTQLRKFVDTVRRDLGTA